MTKPSPSPLVTPSKGTPLGFTQPPKSVQFASLHSNVASSHPSSHAILPTIPVVSRHPHPESRSPPISPTPPPPLPASEPHRPLSFASPGVCRGIRGNPFTRGSQAEVERSSHRNLLIGRLHLVTHLVTGRHGIPCGGASRVFWASRFSLSYG